LEDWKNRKVVSIGMKLMESAYKLMR